MKQRTVWLRAPRPKVDIHTDAALPESWDSGQFDLIPDSILKEQFARFYLEHRKALIELVSSRLAIDLAISNVYDAFGRNQNQTIEPPTETETAAIEQAYSLGLRLYAYHHVLRIIPDAEVRRTLMEALAQSHLARKAPPVAPGSTRSAGRRLSGSETVDSMETMLARIENRLVKQVGAAQSEGKTRKREPVTRKKPR